MQATGKLEEIVPIDIAAYRDLLDKLHQQPKVNHTPTGIPKLDHLITGFEPGRLYILSAMTKQGKTTMAQTFMFNLARKKVASLMFSYEMGWQEVVRQFEAMQTRCNETVELPIYLPLELHRMSGELQYQWLLEAILKAKVEKNVQLVVIDHLHFLIPLKDFQNTSLIIGGVVRELKKMAVECGVALMLIAHVRMVEDDKVPDWTMIRDSSLITQEADMVMMMYRIKSKEAARKVHDESDVNVYTNKTMLSVELNRMGGTTGKVKMIHNGTMFEELTELQDFTDFAKEKISPETIPW